MFAELARTRKAVGIPDSGIEGVLRRRDVGARGTAILGTVTAEDVGVAMARPLDHDHFESTATDRAAALPGHRFEASTPELEGCRASITDMTSGDRLAEPISNLPSRRNAPSGSPAKKRKRRKFTPIDDIFEDFT